MKRLIQEQDIKSVKFEHNKKQQVVHVWVEIEFDDGKRATLHSSLNEDALFYIENELNDVARLMVAKINVEDGGIVA